MLPYHWAPQAPPSSSPGRKSRHLRLSSRFLSTPDPTSPAARFQPFPNQAAPNPRTSRLLDRHNRLCRRISCLHFNHLISTLISSPGNIQWSVSSCLSRLATSVPSAPPFCPGRRLSETLCNATLDVLFPSSRMLFSLGLGPASC
jgi:hypothetical protein